MCPAACPPGSQRTTERKKKVERTHETGHKMETYKGRNIQGDPFIQRRFKRLISKGFYGVFSTSSALFFSGSDVSKEMLDKVERCFLNRYAAQERSQDQYCRVCTDSSQTETIKTLKHLN